MPEMLVYQFLKDKTILLVDDDAFLRSILRKQLQVIPNIDIREASDGHYAIDRLNEGRDSYVMIVSDIDMQHTSGFEVLRALRAGDTKAARDTPVILISSIESLDFKNLASKLDANAYLVKPIPYLELISTIASAIVKPISLMSPSSYTNIDISIDKRRDQE